MLAKKNWKKIEKYKKVDTGFSSDQREWEELEQSNTLIALNILFVPHNSEKIKFKSIIIKVKIK